jgi:alpha-methylacyl-CoA racemase
MAEQTGPLRGIRVVELAGIGPGPYCAMLLADLGADVLRVERPGQGPDAAGPVTMRGQCRIVLDVKRAADLDTLRTLIDKADVLIEPYRPGVTERLGIGPDECLARNPRLVYGRMTGWGQDGPWAGMAGHDIAYIAITGVLHTVGRADGRPQPPANLLGDFAGGSMFLLTGILAALLERERSGQGQVVDAAIVDGASSLAAYLLGLRANGRWGDERGTNLLDSGAPFYDVYETADGKWLAVGALEPKFYAEFVRRLGLDGDGLPPQYELSRWPELRARFEARIKERTRDEWAATFEGSDACVAPVLNFPEAAAHPHLAARGTIVERDGVLQPAAAPRLSRTPPGAGGPTDLRRLLADWGVPVDDAALAKLTPPG